MATMAALKRALSRTPITSSTVIASTISTAGRLITPAGGAAAIHVGRCRPNPRESAGVPAPADGHGHRAHGVIEDEVPANHPGHHLTQRGVGVGVRAAGDGNHRGELRVAQRRKAARQAGQHVPHHDGGARLVGGGGAREDEDARADDRTDAEQGQVERRQRAPQRLAAVLDVADQLLIDLVFRRFESIHPPGRDGMAGAPARLLRLRFTKPADYT